jgi:ubiquinone biosynthesis protein
MAHTLHADFNMVELGKLQARKIITQKLNPLHKPEEVYNWAIDILDLIRDIPYDIGIIIREFRKGRIRIEFEHIGLEPIRQTINRVSNRMALTIIIAALLISSSLIVLAAVPPFVKGISLLGFIGYIIAGILSFILALSVLFRSR